jgi:hypothetical protein
VSVRMVLLYDVKILHNAFQRQKKLLLYSILKPVKHGRLPVLAVHRMMVMMKVMMIKAVEPNRWHQPL